jgi:hypothetical protein
MQSIKLIRLNNNDDIVASVTGGELDGGYIVSDPMLIEFYTKGRHTGLVICNWLPSSLMKSNTIFIKNESILFVSEPSDAFIEYYNKALLELNSPESYDSNQVNDLNQEEITDTTNQLFH